MTDSLERIFISYRREDSAGHVLALLPELRRHFGDRVFKDTDNIPPGEDFVRFIKSELDSCSVLLAVIGRDWLNVQDPRLKTRRLDNPDDFLRLELSTALKSERIRVIPVLVERSTMPSAADLPQDLAELAHRNALELSDARWESDVRLLIQTIQRASAPAAESTEAPRQELQDFRKRRAREIAAHMAAGQEAFDEQDYEGTLQSCEKVLLLDPNGIEALELMDRARKAIDAQKIETWLKQARQSLRHGDTGRASDFIDQALSIDPASGTALELRKEMLAVRRDREHHRERTRAVAAAVQRARTSMDEEDFDAAMRHADDALALEPQSADAQDVRSRAVAALDERRQERQAKRYARQAARDPREGRSAGSNIRPAAPRDAEAQSQTEASDREFAEAEREREPGRDPSDLDVVPETWSIRRYGTIGAAAVVVLISAIALWQYQRGSPPMSTPEINQRPSPPGPRGTTDPPAAVGPSGRETSSLPVAPLSTEPKEERKTRADGAGATPPPPRDREPSRPSSVPGATPTTASKDEGKSGGRGGSSVAPIPTTPADPAPGRSPTVSEMLFDPLLRYGRPRIADVMQRYVTAYNSRNVAAIKELYPSFGGDALQGFDKYELDGVDIKISPGSDSATVSATEIFHYKGLSAPVLIECLFTLRREGNSWTIVTIRRGISRDIRG